MEKKTSDLTTPQREFLAVLEVFSEPVSSKVVSALLPYSHDEILDLACCDLGANSIPAPENDFFVQAPQV